MIQEFLNAWELRKAEVEAEFRKAHPGTYLDVVKPVIRILNESHKWYWPDPDRIHEINEGDYQGTLVYVIASHGYQPSTYWYVRVGYGSCSGCDTLEAIKDYLTHSKPPNDEQVAQYMNLALRVVQELKQMDGESV